MEVSGVMRVAIELSKSLHTLISPTNDLKSVFDCGLGKSERALDSLGLTV